MLYVLNLRNEPFQQFMSLFGVFQIVTIYVYTWDRIFSSEWSSWELFWSDLKCSCNIGRTDSLSTPTVSTTSWILKRLSLPIAYLFNYFQSRRIFFDFFSSFDLFMPPKKAVYVTYTHHRTLVREKVCVANLPNLLKMLVYTCLKMNTTFERVGGTLSERVCVVYGHHTGMWSRDFRWLYNVGFDLETRTVYLTNTQFRFFQKQHYYSCSR